MSLNRFSGIAAIIVVIAGLVLAFVFLGTPAHQRRISLDERRTGDLISIANVVHDRYRTGGLPERLPQGILGQDPVTNRSYEYRRIDAGHYVLCAVFDTDQPTENGAEYAEHAVVWPHGVWRHGTGRTCYKVDVTEDEAIPRRI